MKKIPSIQSFDNFVNFIKSLCDISILIGKITSAIFIITMKYLAFKIRTLLKLLLVYKKAIIIILLILAGTSISLGYYYYWIYAPNLIEVAAVAAIEGGTSEILYSDFIEPARMTLRDAIAFSSNPIATLNAYVPKNELSHFISNFYPKNIYFDAVGRPYYIITNEILHHFITTHREMPVDKAFEMLLELSTTVYGAVQGSLEFVLKAIEINNGDLNYWLLILKLTGYVIVIGISVAAGGSAIAFFF